MCIVTTLLAGQSAGAQAMIGEDWRADVTAFVRSVVEAGLAPGMQVAVAAGDWVVYEQGFGLADLDTGRPVTGATRFYIASTTKSFTGLMAVLLAEQGELDLESPMVHSLPAAQLPPGVSRDAVTVGHLLAMTHGLDGDGPIVTRTAYTGEFSRDDLLTLLRHHNGTDDFGRYRYNNLAYNLLGLVLEARSGIGWKELVARNILDPVGMTATTANVSTLATDQLALPHRDLPDGFRRTYLTKTDANMHAAGGHFATAGDLARYLAAHISGGVVDGQRVLPEAAIRESHRKLADQDRRFGPHLHRFGWAAGWDLGSYEGDTLIHRFGGYEGYLSHMSFMPRHGLGVAVLVNGSGSAAAAADLVATYIYDRLLGKPDLANRATTRFEEARTAAAGFRSNLARQLAERAARAAPLPHPLEAYAGVYASPILGRMEWRVVAGGLELRAGAVRSRAEVFDASRNQLRVEIGGGGTVVTFSFPSGAGPATGVSLAGREFVRVAPGGAPD